VDKRYVISDFADEAMNLRGLKWQINRNEVILTWDWPIDREIRFALVFKCDENHPTIEKLIHNNHPHEVVVRDLASSFTTTIPKERCKFLICPAYFNDNKTINICPNEIVTDWIYKKAVVSINVQYKNIALGQYQKATLQIAISDTEQIEMLAKVLIYSIYETGAKVASYPIDTQLIRGGGHLYIKKSQSIEFELHKDYTHLFELR